MRMQESLTRTASQHKHGMIWVEVTNGCNLVCRHCYSDSYPGSSCRDSLSHEDFLRIIDEAAIAGFSTIQFIGGEPFLYKKLPELVACAQSKSFAHVEIFSNLTIPRPDVLNIIDPNRTSIATSVYTNDPQIHDRITNKVGSFDLTMEGIKRVVECAIELRVGFIEMKENIGHFEKTCAFLENLGIQSVGFDRMRGIGRGGAAQKPALNQLCGACAGNTLCVTYDGLALPCIMSRAWPIGFVKQDSLDKIMKSRQSSDIRALIADELNSRNDNISGADCFPKVCNPEMGCPPLRQHGFVKKTSMNESMQSRRSAGERSLIDKSTQESKNENCFPGLCSPDVDCNPIKSRSLQRAKKGRLASSLDW